MKQHILTMGMQLIVIKICFVFFNLSLVMAAGIQTVEESCVLSLVVPRDKIKTSCSIDDKLKRRLNTMETKINIYKQQVLELETQIHKERLLNNDKIMSLEAMLFKVDKLEELDKRLSYVESLQQREIDNFIPKDSNLNYFSESDNFIPSDQSAETSYQWKKYTKPVKDKKSSEEKLKLLQELENMKNNINKTGDNIINKVEDVLKNMTEKVILNKTLIDNLEETSEGENGSAFGEYINEEASNRIQNDQPTKITKLAGSRILSNETDSNENIHRNLTEKHSKQTESNAIPIGKTLVSQLEEMFKKEIEYVLNAQMEEVISLVQKQSETIEDSQNGHTNYINMLSEQHLSDNKYLIDKIDSMELSMNSITQTMDIMYSKSDKLQLLPALFEEFKKNLTDKPIVKSTGDKSIGEKLDEHSKKLRTMDRLAAIFQRSLEHYRNESKASYAEIDRKISSESIMVKALRESLLHNVSTIIDEKVNQQNISVKRKLREMDTLMKSVEDQNVLMQVDLGTKERKLKSRMSKLEHDLKIAKQDVQILGFSQSNMQKQQDSLVEQVESLGKNTALQKRFEMLELEFKLSLSDDWVEYPFIYDQTRTACFGLQFIKRTDYKNGRYVGAILCNNHRYKIVLGQNLNKKFMNIGDEVGYGEDHCEFVGGKRNTIPKISKPSYSFTQERGFTRSIWGEEPHIATLDFIKPSPSWYECDVAIP